MSDKKKNHDCRQPPPPVHQEECRCAHSCTVLRVHVCSLTCVTDRQHLEVQPENRRSKIMFHEEKKEQFYKEFTLREPKPGSAEALVLLLAAVPALSAEQSGLDNRTVDGHVLLLLLSRTQRAQQRTRQTDAKSCSHRPRRPPIIMEQVSPPVQ